MLEIKRPVSAPLSPEQVAAIQEVVARFKAVKGGLQPAMHAVQALCGNWLPMEALQLISEGKTNKEIARILSLSINTVESHRKHVMEKLDLHNTAEIVRFAVRKGIVQ